MSITSLIIRRSNSFLGAGLRAFHILLDDVSIAQIRRGQELRLAVEPGIHFVQFRIDWVKSARITVIADVNFEVTLDVAFVPNRRAGSLEVNVSRLPRLATFEDTLGSNSRDSGSQQERRSEYSSSGDIDAWWVVLGVEHSSNADEIKRAYRALAGQYHPDKVESLGADLKELANRKMQMINLAYERARRDKKF